jgi:hypothetical protein
VRSRTLTRTTLGVVALVALAGTTALQAADDTALAPAWTAGDGSARAVAAAPPGADGIQGPTSLRLPSPKKMLLCAVAVLRAVAMNMVSPYLGAAAMAEAAAACS